MVMEPMIEEAYDALTPADRLIIDSTIMALHEKDNRLSVMLSTITELTDKKGPEE